MDKDQISSLIYFYDENGDITSHPDYERFLKFEIEKKLPDLHHVLKNYTSYKEMLKIVIDTMRLEIE